MATVAVGRFPRRLWLVATILGCEAALLVGTAWASLAGEALGVFAFAGEVYLIGVGLSLLLGPVGAALIAGAIAVLLRRHLWLAVASILGAAALGVLAGITTRLLGWLVLNLAALALLLSARRSFR